MTILDDIVTATKLRVEKEKLQMPLDEIVSKVESPSAFFEFECALKISDIAFICEIKKASPSKGVIVQDFPYVQIAKEYENAGANAISVLTEPEFFMGSDNYLREIKNTVKIPVLRKDFIIDEYQIYQSALIGADAILLICAILSRDELSQYLKTADKLGLSTLVEAHDENEVKMALEAGARIIGVNNRNLKTFEVNLDTTERLRSLVPEDKIFVSESGIKTRDDILRLEKIGVNAVLIGETLMLSRDKSLELQKLRGGTRG